MPLLSGKNILITGVSSKRSIARAVSYLFSSEGCKLILADIDGRPAVELAQEIGPSHLGIQCDITDPGDCSSVAQAAERFGGIDAMVHCAGVAEPKSLSELTPERLQWMLDINLSGTIYLVQALAPLLVVRGGGSIVLLSSLAAQRGGGFVGGLHYAAAKAGVLGFMKGLARELGPKNIRVNAIAPGLVDTDMTVPFMPQDVRARLAEQAVLGRVARADEIAAACLFLASDLSTYITGTTLDVNGGLHIH